MSNVEDLKLEILDKLRREGYNLCDSTTPGIKTMALGGGYTLECNAKRPSTDWKIIRNNGGEITEFSASTKEVDYTHLKDADSLIQKYNNELFALFDGGVRAGGSEL